jgi:xanthosine utilization system XapX-like protein
MRRKSAAVGVGVGCACLAALILAAGEVFGIVWAIVQLCSPGHPWLILDIVLLVLLVPSLFANRVPSTKA